MSNGDIHRQQLAVAMLGIATAAIGFGLFGSDLRLAWSPWEQGWSAWRQSVQIFSFAGCLISYGGVLISTVWMLARADHVKATDLVNGPLFWFICEMLSLGVLYVVNILSPAPAPTIPRLAA